MFYSAERVEASSWLLSICNALALPLVLLTVCELWLPSPPAHLTPTLVYHLFDSFTKAKMIGFIQNKSFSAFRKRAWSTHFIQGKNPVWNTKNESSIGFCYEPQSKLHFQAVFLGEVVEGRKRKIDSE